MINDEKSIKNSLDIFNEKYNDFLREKFSHKMGIDIPFKEFKSFHDIILSLMQKCELDYSLFFSLLSDQNYYNFENESFSIDIKILKECTYN